MEIELREFTDTMSDTTHKDGVIENVLVHGAQTRNKRKYLPQAVRDIARLAEGVAVYTDHPVSTDKDRGGRAAADRFGTLRNIRLCETSDGLTVRGDLHYLTTHPLCARVAEDQERKLNLFGLSIFGRGDGRTENGIAIVESVPTLKEVDLVTNAATALNLREAEEVYEEKPAPKTTEEHTSDSIESGVKAILSEDSSLDEKVKKVEALFKAMLTEVEEKGEEAEAKAEETAAEAAPEKKPEEVAEQAQTLDLSEQITAAVEKAVASLKGELDTIKKSKWFGKSSTVTPAANITLSEQEESIPVDPAGKREYFNRR